MTMDKLRSGMFEVEDKYGEPVQVYWQGNGLRKVRETRTPALAINEAIGSIVGQRVKHLRLERGMTLAELCMKAGLATTTPKSRMWEIENSVRRQAVTFGTLYAIALALDVDVSDLMPSMSEIRTIAASREVREATGHLERYYATSPARHG